MNLDLLMNGCWRFGKVDWTVKMVNFFVLLLLWLLTWSNGILDYDIHINSNLKSALMKINSSVFSKKFQILRGEATEFRTFTNPFTTRSGDIGKGFRSSFKLLCRTFLSKLESRRCKPVCYNGKCYNFCSQIRERSTY